MLNSYSKTAKKNTWLRTLRLWCTFLGLSVAWLFFIAVAFVVGTIVIGDTVSVWKENHRFSQPRDALKWSPAYVQVVENVETYCSNGCSQDQLDFFLRARDVALQKEWPKVLAVTLQDWRWHQHTFVAYNMEWKIRDDYLAVISRVGGPEAAVNCQAIVEWTVLSVSVVDSFVGLLCNGEEYLLTY